MHRHQAVVAMALLLSSAPMAVSCSGSDATAQLPTTLPATVCADGDADRSRTVTFTVVAPADGSAGLSAVTPSVLTAGPVRIAVEADASNAEVTEVRISSAGAEVTVVRGVPAGDSCAVDLDLAAGRYTASAGGRSVDFDVQP
jgi:hypothetical protein